MPRFNTYVSVDTERRVTTFNGVLPPTFLSLNRQPCDNTSSNSTWQFYQIHRIRSTYYCDCSSYYRSVDKLYASTFYT